MVLACRAMQPMAMCWTTSATIQAQGTKLGRSCLPTGPHLATAELVTTATVTKAKDPQAAMDLEAGAIRIKAATSRGTTRATTEGRTPLHAISVVEAPKIALFLHLHSLIGSRGSIG